MPIFSTVYLYLMAFPISRNDLNNVSTALDHISTLNGISNNISSFIERRVHDLTKKLLRESINGKTNIDIHIVMEKNFAPVLDGLQTYLPDSTFTPNSSTNQIYIDWSQ